MTAVEIGVVGGGPAGVAAAVQLRRHGLEVLLFEADAIGGLTRNAHSMENLPGFPDGITGPQFARRLAEHLTSAGVDPVHEEVASIAYDGGFELCTERARHRIGRLVIATGTEPIPLDDPEIGPAVASRVLYEVHRIARIEGSRVAIIGAGDAAFDYALTLSARNEVTILNRSKRRRCLPLLWERCRATRSITYLENTRVTRIEEGERGLSVGTTGRSGEQHLDVDYLIAAIGRRPRMPALDPRLEGRVGPLKEAGILFLAGDVRGGRTRQASIAFADGVRAAMEIAAAT
ncbi:MAG: NAD(P)/FAD-dependent oxidoreductase, partial [Candidatus Bipolaricaulota bacterium]